MKNLLAAVSAFLLLAGCINTSKSNKPLIVLQEAPEFSLRNVRGGEFKSSDLRGKVVVIDFWATWCVPCKVEIPRYNELRAKMKDKGVEFLGVTFDSGSAEKVLPVMEELQMKYPVVMASDFIDAALGGHFGYPTTFLVGKDWKVYRKIIGSPPNKMEDLERDINALLAKPED
jgi:cytochrome c biogenesis protein CcmG, thiol:disulfide interchange protein DsbE